MTALQGLLPYIPRQLGIRFNVYLWPVSAAIEAIFPVPAKPDLSLNCRAPNPGQIRPNLSTARLDMAAGIRSD
jgi:hypothetical protein